MAVLPAGRATLPFGLAIAGGGAAIVTILGGRWPEWLQAVLALGFVVTGYVLMLDGLSRYRRVARIIKAEDPDHHRVVSPWVMTLLIGVVQIVVTVVVVLLIYRVRAGEEIEPEELLEVLESYGLIRLPGAVVGVDVDRLEVAGGSGRLVEGDLGEIDSE